MREPARTADAREAVRRRVRRVTGVVVAASLAVAGSIAAYVAGAGTQKSVGGTTTTARTTTATAKVPVPPSPTPPSLDSHDSSSPPPLQSAPAQAPTPSPSPPVAVSGGS